MKTIIIEQLEVYNLDLGKMNWYKAKEACESLGNGWHLPSIKELRCLYENRDKLGEWANSFHWSEDDYVTGKLAFYINFDDGEKDVYYKYGTLSVRPVRQLTH
jgi:hypothetical protein